MKERLRTVRKKLATCVCFVGGIAILTGGRVETNGTAMTLKGERNNEQ